MTEEYADDGGIDSGLRLLTADEFGKRIFGISIVVGSLVTAAEGHGGMQRCPRQAFLNNAGSGVAATTRSDAGMTFRVVVIPDIIATQQLGYADEMDEVGQHIKGRIR